MRASRDFPLGVLVAVLANILTTYADPTAFYFFSNLLVVNDNGERMNFEFYPNGPNCVQGELPKGWNALWRTCLVIHDDFEDPTKPNTSSVLIKEALLNVGRPCNVVIVDWHLDAGFGDLKTTWEKKLDKDVESADFTLHTVSNTLNISFTTAVPDVAYQVALFIQWIRKTLHTRKNFDVKSLEVTAFTHGIGGQVIGCAAQVLTTLKEPRIETIIATDPTSRRLDGEDSPTTAHFNYLNKKSARRVISIKTNVGGLGSHHIDGHITFYINNEYVRIEKDNFAAVSNGIKGDGAMVKFLQIQPGYMNQRKGNERLFYSHGLAVKFLAEQILAPTQVEHRELGVVTLFGEDVDVRQLPLSGWLIVLSWKNNGPPKLEMSNFVTKAKSDDGVIILSKVEELNCKPVIVSDLQGPKETCPAEADFTPKEFNSLTSIGMFVSNRVKIIYGHAH